MINKEEFVAFREEWGCSVFEAKAHFQNRELKNELNNASTQQEILAVHKRILELLIDQNFPSLNSFIR